MSGWQAGQAVTWVRHVFLGVQGGRLLVRGFAGGGLCDGGGPTKGEHVEHSPPGIPYDPPCLSSCPSAQVGAVCPPHGQATISTWSGSKRVSAGRSGNQVAQQLPQAQSERPLSNVICRMARAGHPRWSHTIMPRPLLRCADAAPAGVGSNHRGAHPGIKKAPPIGWGLIFWWV